MDKVEKKIQTQPTEKTESLTEQNILFAELVVEKLRSSDYRRTIIWMAVFTVIIIITIMLSTYFVHKTFHPSQTILGDTHYTKTQELATTLTNGETYISENGKTTIYEKAGVIYAIGHLTKAEKEADKKHYQKRMAERDRQIKTQLNQEHELKVAIERTKTAALLGSVGKIIVRPEYIAKRLIEEKTLEPIVELKVENIIKETIVEEIIPVVSKSVIPIITPIPSEEPEPKKPGKDKEPNPNKPEKPDKPETPPGQEDKPDKPEKPNKGKGKGK